MDSPAEIILRYARSGGRRPPRDKEMLEINRTGAYSLWRSIGAATFPPSPIGRFVGKLPPEELQGLLLEVQNCKQVGNLSINPPPDAAIETVHLPGVQAALYIHAEPTGAWGLLMGRIRAYLASLPESPLAAISLEVFPGGQAARLTHLGPDPLEVDFTNLSVRAVLWDGYRKAGDWFAPKMRFDFPKRITAIKDWSLDLPFDHGFSVDEGQVVVAYVTFTIFDGAQPIPVSLESLR